MMKTMFYRRMLGAALVALGLLNCAAAGTPVAAPSTIPVSDFFTVSEMWGPVLSPDGSAIAVLIHNDGGHRVLAVVDTADLTKIKVVALFSDGADIVNVQWLNDTRLVYQQGREEDNVWDQKGGAGLYAVDRDGSNQIRLIDPASAGGDSDSIARRSRTLGADHQFVATLGDGSDDVVIERITGTWSGSIAQHFEMRRTIPLLLDTRTGLTHSLVEGSIPEHVHQWVTDRKGKVVAAVQADQGQTVILLPAGPGQWKELRRFSSYGPTPDAFEIVQVSADGNLYATHTMPGPEATRGLFRVDLASGKLDPDPIVSVKGFDFTGNLVEDAKNHKLLGVRYVSDASGTVWLDKDMQDVQAKVDAKLPGLINTIGVARCRCSQKMVVTSYSDRQPGKFYIYDAATDTLTAIGSVHSAISPRQMADTDFVRIKARDGRDLPVYITKPHGKGPWPTVVYVHGGPQVRGWYWGWDAESQFLASRGYLVVKPEYRGSAGYGQAHLVAGFKQWGLASQDDIADATVWAAKQGLADANRTCIMGASYGGYATLMGLVRYGDLYRCGVAWSAVTDIDLMYDIWQSDLSDEWKGYGMPVMVGDRVKDAAQFAATSPLKQAARIKRPLLLAHGDLDARVPITHATALRDALQANHAPLTWIDYPKEAHGWYDPATSIAWNTEVLKFLDANIGPNAPVDAPKR